MLKMLLDLLLSIISHPQSMLAGLAIGYLLPSDVSSIIAFIKSKL